MTSTSEYYTLSLHDALPISPILGSSLWIANWGKNPPLCDEDLSCGKLLHEVQNRVNSFARFGLQHQMRRVERDVARVRLDRSEEHTSELQSQSNLVCRLLLE